MSRAAPVSTARATDLLLAARRPAMAGENQAFDDMDAAPVTELR